MPWLLAVSDGRYRSALGIRTALQPLFIEQYLSTSVEQALSSVVGQVTRSEIAEIGHLYSNAKRFTLPLLLVAAVSLFCNDYKYMVFSGTDHVLSLLAKTGVDCHFIAHADQAKLTPSTDNWGSYYQTNPKVVFVELSQVIHLLNTNPRYFAMFESLNEKIASAATLLKEGC
ncbi:thermostable hemolysin [Colwellia sp. MEBiC06753]